MWSIPVGLGANRVTTVSTGWGWDIYDLNP
jgi:hypothetical protein